MQVIYLSLAILMGGGLVLFGIGGDVNGGLFDAFSNSDGDANEQFEERRDDAAKKTEQNPNNPAFWADLATAEYQLATSSKGYNQTENTFSGAARGHLVAARDAWNRHVKLAGDKVNGDAAATMRAALSSLDDNTGAVRAQEAYLESLGDDVGPGDFGTLAQLAYLAGQDRKGDLAADRAVELTPKDERKDFKEQLDQVKAQIALQQQQQGASTTPAPTTTSGGALPTG
ncbi:MAG TPA: hypothetical protein VN238_20135 [Solirubrobacteraceae bacterium]|nr:hypothetical protein [Solirubrobacteraceae bacterium]